MHILGFLAIVLLVVLSSYTSRSARLEFILLALILLIAYGITEAKMSGKKLEVPGTLSLILERERSLPLRHHIPPLNMAHVLQAARLHAEVHNSDPFAYGRVKTHMLNGIENVGEVHKAARLSLAARSHAKVKVLTNAA